MTHQTTEKQCVSEIDLYRFMALKRIENLQNEAREIIASSEIADPEELTQLHEEYQCKVLDIFDATFEMVACLKDYSAEFTQINAELIGEKEELDIIKKHLTDKSKISLTSDGLSESLFVLLDNMESKLTTFANDKLPDIITKIKGTTLPTEPQKTAEVSQSASAPPQELTP